MCDAVIDTLSIYPVPVDSEWKLPVITELIEFKRGLISLDLLTRDEAGVIIGQLCSH